MRGTDWRIASGMSLIILAGLYWMGRENPQSDHRKLILQARASLKSSQPDAALRTAVSLLDRSPEDAARVAAALEALGDAAGAAQVRGARKGG